MRGKDTAARYGGDEFEVLLPEMTGVGVAGIAVTLRRAIASSQVKRADTAEAMSPSQ